MGRTLRELMAALPPERRHKVAARASELLAEAEVILALHKDGQAHFGAD